MSLLKDVLKQNAASPELLKFLRENAKDYQAIYADEPARYYFQENDKEYWDIAKDFQNIAPPFEAMWVEFAAPKKVVSKVYGESDYPEDFWKRAAVLLTANDTKDYTSPHPLAHVFPGARWIVSGHVFIEGDHFIRNLALDSLRHSLVLQARQEIGTMMHQKGMYLTSAQQEETVQRAVDEEMAKITSQIPDVLQVVTIWYGITPEGKLLVQDGRGYVTLPGEGLQEHFNVTQEGLSLFKDYTDNIVKIALLSVYFMHAKGVELKSAHTGRKKKKRRPKRRKKGSTPEIRFKTVDIGLDVQRDIQRAQQEGGGVLKALHLRRGHFKTFTKPMFGREGGKTGSIWVRPHIVGKKDLGEIQKSYRVRKPEDEMPGAQRNPFDGHDDWIDYEESDRYRHNPTPLAEAYRLEYHLEQIGRLTGFRGQFEMFGKLLEHLQLSLPQQWGAKWFAATVLTYLTDNSFNNRLTLYTDRVMLYFIGQSPKPLLPSSRIEIVKQAETDSKIKQHLEEMQNILLGIFEYFIRQHPINLSLVRMRQADFISTLEEYLDRTYATQQPSGAMAQPTLNELENVLAVFRRFKPDNLFDINLYLTTLDGFPEVLANPELNFLEGGLWEVLYSYALLADCFNPFKGKVKSTAFDTLSGIIYVEGQDLSNVYLLNDLHDLYPGAYIPFGLTHIQKVLHDRDRLRQF